MKRIRLEVTAGDALRIARGVLPAISRDEVTPVLTGARFTIDNGVVVTATDRYRVHQVRVPELSSRNGKALDAIVPAHVLLWLSKVSARIYPRGPYAGQVLFEFEQPETGDAPGVGKVAVTVTAENSPETVRFEGGLIRGKYPPVGRLIDKAKRAETAVDIGLLDVSYIADVQKAVGSHARVVVRHTKGDDGVKYAPTYVWCDGWFEALIQQFATAA